MRVWCNLSVPIVALTTLPATAQTQVVPATATAPAATQDRDAAAPLGDIVVTAQRRAQNLQDVPISITAVSGDEMVAAGIQDPRDLGRLIPNFSAQSAFSVASTSLFIRGVGIGDFNANSTGAVGVYVDDVFLGANSGKLFNVFDGDGVEVLKGPQGTLYGRNTTAGAVRFSSRKPTDTLEADVSALYGRFNEVRLEGGIGGPIIDDLLKVRVSGLYQRRDGFTFNRYTGHYVNNVNLWATRVIADLTPSNDLLIRFSAHTGRNTGGARQFQHVGQGITLDGKPNFSPTGVPLDGFGYADTDNDIDAGSYNIEGRELLDVFGASMNVQYHLGGVSLTSITAYEQVNHATLEDTDASPNNMITADYRDRPRQLTQEIRLASDAGGRLTWVVGGYYFNDTLKVDSAYDILRGLRDSADPLASFDPVSGVGLLRFRYTQYTRSLAAFGQADYRLTDRVTATLGLRYSSDDIRLKFSSFYDEPEPVGHFPVLTDDQSQTFPDLSYRAALNYKVGRTLVYASASKGYNSGGFAGGASTDADQLKPFRSERLYSYEAGLKTDLFDRHVRFNTAAFLYDYKDLQVFVFDVSGPIPVQRKLNAGSARIYGVEAEVTAQPITGLTFNVAASAMHTEYVQFTALVSASYTGNHLINAPAISAAGGVTYETSVRNAGLLRARIDGSYQSRTYLSPDNISSYQVAPYALLNARISCLTPDKSYEFALFGRNITQKRFLTYRSPAVTQDQLNYNDPGTYGVQVVAHLR